MGIKNIFLKEWPTELCNKLRSYLLKEVACIKVCKEDNLESLRNSKEISMDRIQDTCRRMVRVEIGKKLD